MNHLETENAVLRSQLTAVNARLSVALADNGHLRSVLSQRFERKWRLEDWSADHAGSDTTGFCDGRL